MFKPYTYTQTIKLSRFRTWFANVLNDFNLTRKKFIIAVSINRNSDV